MIVSGLDWSRDCVEIGAELLVITKHPAFWAFCSLVQWNLWNSEVCVGGSSFLWF